MLVACTEDEPWEKEDRSNVNSNATLVSQTRETSVTESTSTDCQQVAMRMEVPRLQCGVNDLFVVHTVGGAVNYCMEYDCSLRANRWTAYQWYKGMSSKETKWDRGKWKKGETFNGYGGRSDPFQPDPIIPSQYQTTLSDHANNGYDRGHMLGSADRLNSKEANGQTFYLSNMHPQLGDFNQHGIWYNLENRLRSEYDKDSFRDTLYVVKGGTIAQGQYAKGKNNLPVPKYFFMAILCKNSDKAQNGYKAIAFWMEHKANNDANYAQYAISIDDLEKKTGIDFFCNLPDKIEQQVESNLVLSAWGLK